MSCVHVLTSLFSGHSGKARPDLQQTIKQCIKSYYAVKTVVNNRIGVLHGGLFLHRKTNLYKLKGNHKMTPMMPHPLVSYYLSLFSRYHVKIVHIAGTLLRRLGLTLNDE